MFHDMSGGRVAESSRSRLSHVTITRAPSALIGRCSVQMSMADVDGHGNTGIDSTTNSNTLTTKLVDSYRT